VELLIVMMDLDKLVIITLPHSKTRRCSHSKIKESLQDVDTPFKIIPLYFLNNTMGTQSWNFNLIFAIDSIIAKLQPQNFI